VKLKALVGRGDKSGLAVGPVFAAGLVLNILFPEVFRVAGPSAALRTVSWIVLVPGLVVWAWSVALILIRVPRGELITPGPYAWVKHPLYTGVALLVLPWQGFLLDTWLGAAVGLALYLASRRFSRAEEEALAKTFGPAWDAYQTRVKLPWI